MRLAPLSVLRRFPRGQSGAERARGQHYRNEPPVLHDVHTPQGRDVLEKATEIVLRVASGYTLRHLAILAKTIVSRKRPRQSKAGPRVEHADP